ncbi:MAG: RNA methyltransferase [Deltaproteobacteria bacterium]
MTVSIALLHYPVLNRFGDTIASAVTNLDIHDLARLARTYGISRFFVVTPIAEQQDLVRELVGHWTGSGAVANPDRKSAMELVSIATDLHEVREMIQKKADYTEPMRIYATSARWETCPKTVPWHVVREEMTMKRRHGLILFGTASGLSEEVMGEVDGILPPIRGVGEYNHLSVRAAAAITLDRLFGENRRWGYAK